MERHVRTRLGAVLATLSLIGLALPAAGQVKNLSGHWEVRADQGDTAISTTLELTGDGGQYSGQSGPLDTFGTTPLEYRGTLVDDRLHLVVSTHAGPVGTLDLLFAERTLTGSGTLFGTPVTVSGRRPAPGPAGPKTYDYDPTRFHVLTSSTPEPVLRVFPGDTIRTRTVDCNGVDEKGAQAGMPGNPGTGPFYVEGAMPGDTVGIRIISLRPNRSTATMYSGSLSGRAVTSDYVQHPVIGRSNLWKLDSVHGTASPEMPSDRLKQFSVPMRPMLGVVAVAPPAGLSAPNSDEGEWGGNLDYPEVREGVTLYLPVYQAGAMIYVGDAHARQGDGEITGQGLETSMAVEFQVVLIKHPTLPQPWAENDGYVMVSGIGGSLNDALARATRGLATWLKASYQLDDSDVAAVLGSSIEYDVAEIVDPKFHIVAKIRKDFLAKISPPPS